jgi:hypothetical protein
VFSVVIRSDVRREHIAYENISGDVTSVEGWLVPEVGGTSRGATKVREFPAGNPYPDEIYAMISAGYVYLFTVGEGRYLLDLASGETRQLSGPEERPHDFFVPSRDGKLLAHVLRDEQTDCEFNAVECRLRVEFLDAYTLERTGGAELSLRAPTYEELPFYPRFEQRFAWTAAGTFRVTHVSTVDLTPGGPTREVPFEPCYYAATSSGPVSLAGERFEQHVTPQGVLAGVTTTSVFVDSATELATRCVLPAE